MTADSGSGEALDLGGPSDAKTLLLLCSEYGHVTGVLTKAEDRQGANAACQIGKVCALLAADQDDPAARALEAKRLRMLIKLSYQIVRLDKKMEAAAGETVIVDPEQAAQALPPC